MKNFTTFPAFPTGASEGLLYAARVTMGSVKNRYFRPCVEADTEVDELVGLGHSVSAGTDVDEV